MVRRIKECGLCVRRFIALADAPVCDACCDAVDTAQSSDAAPTNTVDMIDLLSSAPEEDAGGTAHVHAAGADDASVICCGSEGGDDIHCTQGSFDVEDSNNKDGRLDDTEDGTTDSALCKAGPANVNAHARTPPIQTTPVDFHTVTITKTATANGSSSTDYDAHREDSICFICGKSLLQIKHRVAHMKRCAKKHQGATADLGMRDSRIGLMKDDGAFPNDQCQVTQSSASTNTTITRNPYAQKGSITWHGDANDVLKSHESETHSRVSSMASSSTLSSSIAGTGGGSAQVSQHGGEGTSLASKKPPARDLNSVLIANARRLSQIEAIRAKQRADSRTQHTSYGRGRGAWRGPYKNRKYNSENCPSYKKITGTDFVCDGFYYANESFTKNYFLTHFHSDHYGGITSAWNQGIIYCSLPTANLVNAQLGVDKKYLHPLPMMVPTVVESRGKAVTVTLLDANHCPGAVMFLFQVGPKHILHVGDFRWSRDIMFHQQYLKPFLFSRKLRLDELFLDTTYCNPKYTLPSQEQTVQATLKVVQDEVKRAKESGSRVLHLFGAYTIGKERMYMAVAQHFGWRIFVDRRRYRVLQASGWPPEQMTLFTTTPTNDSCIWVVPMGDLNMKKLPKYFETAMSLSLASPGVAPCDRIVGYSPTGWSLSAKPGRGLVGKRSSGKITIYSVPYSEHSSFPELVDCLKCLNPRRTIPTVSVSKTKEQLALLEKGARETQTTIQLRSS